MFLMIKLINSNLGKGTIGTGLFDHENTISLSVPTWDGRKIWNHIGIGILVLFLQGVGIGQDTPSVCISISLSVKISIFFIGIVRIYYLYCGKMT